MCIDECKSSNRNKSQLQLTILQTLLILLIIILAMQIVTPDVVCDYAKKNLDSSLRKPGVITLC